MGFFTTNKDNLEIETLKKELQKLKKLTQKI